MPNHTPGNWEGDSDGHIYPEEETFFRDGYSPHIAKVNPARSATREFEANIRLIAAAPKMLEALKRVSRELAYRQEDLDYGIPDPDGYVCSCSFEMPFVEEVIAEVEGR